MVVNDLNGISKC